MSEFRIKYYERDNREKQKKFHGEVVYRDQIIKNPIQLRPGQTVGPFYDFETTTLVYHEDDDTQVYTYEKERVFMPDEKYVDYDVRRREVEGPREYVYPKEDLVKLPDDNRSDVTRQ